MIIFCLNGISIASKIYGSTIVLIIQIIHIINIFLINPYKQCLKVHTIGMMLNNAIYLVFLIIINFINYFDEINQTLMILLGYGMSTCCGISIIITIIRLYYELRYGRAL